MGKLYLYKYYYISILIYRAETRTQIKADASTLTAAEVKNFNKHMREEMKTRKENNKNN
jgi:hypothetical protein